MVGTLLLFLLLGACTTRYPASSSSPLTTAELKYRLMEQFGPVAFCGPPVGKSSEAAKADAVAAFPAIQQDRETYAAIVSHTNLSHATDLTADEKLVVYNEYRRLQAITLDPAGDAQHFALLFADQGDAKRTVFIEGTIDPYGAIQVTRRESRGALNCPICLAAGTRIDTPDGAIAVEALREGMRVWTVDERGGRIVGHVVATGRTPVPPEHEMVLLGLADGRELEASPGHLDAEGRALGDLSAGDVLDGSRVTAAERLRYMLPFTYDILPSGTTGLYWANGVLLRSTLRD